MDFTVITTLIGLLVTIILGYPTFIAWIKSNTPKIIYVENERLNLFNIVSRNIDGLDITYNGERVNNNSYLLRAFFLYQGREDITNDKTRKSIYLELPEGSIWHSQRIIKTSKDLEIDASVIENRIFFNFDLLKNNEYFSFEIYVEVGADSGGKDIFLPGHRIVNLGAIEKKNYEDTRPIPYVGAMLMFFALILFAPACLAIYTILNSNTLGLDYYSDDITKEYYYNNNRIDLDSLDNIFLYRRRKWNNYADLLNKGKARLDTIVFPNEESELLSLQRNIMDMLEKPEKIFNDRIGKDYEIWDNYKLYRTKKYILNQQCSVVFIINVEKPMIEITSMFLFGLFLLVISFYMFYYWYKNRTLTSQIFLIKNSN